MTDARLSPESLFERTSRGSLRPDMVRGSTAIVKLLTIVQGKLGIRRFGGLHSELTGNHSVSPDLSRSDAVESHELATGIDSLLREELNWGC